jgi:hypothetical protein
MGFVLNAILYAIFTFLVRVLCYGTGKLAVVALSFGNVGCEPFDGGKENYGWLGRKTESGSYAVSNMLTTLVGLGVITALVVTIGISSR